MISVVVIVDPDSSDMGWLSEYFRYILNYFTSLNEIIVIDEINNITLEQLHDIVCTLADIHAIEMFSDRFTFVLQGSNATVVVRLYDNIEKLKGYKSDQCCDSHRQ